MSQNARYDRSHFISLTKTKLVLVTAISCCPAFAVEGGIEPAHSKVLTTLHSFTDSAANLAKAAISLLGIHYRYGGNSPEHGLDCSGFVRYVFKQAQGADLPRTSAEISKLGETVLEQHMQPGDLVFFDTMKRSFSHVGIYLGESRFIHAPSSGGTVRIENMNVSYWKQRFNGARRIIGNSEQNQGKQ